MKSAHTHNPTTVMMKEDGNVDFLASLVNLVKDDNPFTNTQGKGETMVLGVTDEAYRRREQAHHRLLDEQGFPAEVEPEQNRYIPTAEIELDENSKPINVKPPWVVNEAGQDLGTSYAHEALTKPSAKDIHDKPYNLQKFVGLSGQRKKALIVEGYDSALDAFIAKDIDQTETSTFAINRHDKTKTSGELKVLPILVNLVQGKKSKTVKKSVDCGCD